MTQQMVCQCCGMQLRATPTEKELKEKLNMKRKEKRKLGIVSKPHRLHCGIFGCGNIATEKCPVAGCEMRLCSEHKFKHGHTYLDRGN